MLIKKRFLLILFLIFLAGFSLRPGITSLAPLLGDIQSHFGASESTLGLLTSIPVMCMGLMSPFAHMLVKRIGMKATLLLGFIFIALGEILRLQTQWLSVLLATALFVGIGDALVRPVLSGFIKQHSGKRTPIAIGWYAASMGIGSGCAAIFSTPISAMFNGFAFALAFWSVPTLLCILTFSIGVPQSKSSHSLTKTLDAHHQNLSQLAILVLLFALQAGLNYVISAWLPQWLLAQNKSASLANQYTFLFIITQTVTSLIYPICVFFLHNNAAKTALLAGIPLIIGSVSYVTDCPIWLPIMLISIGVGIIFPLVLQLPLIVTKTPSDAIHLSGIVQTLGYLLGGTAPLLVGYGTTHLGIILALNISVAILIFSILIIGFMLLYSINPPDK